MLRHLFVYVSRTVSTCSIQLHIWLESPRRFSGLFLAKTRGEIDPSRSQIEGELRRWK